MSNSPLAPAELAETYLGNVNERADLSLQVAQARENGHCREITINRRDRPKGRILAQTADGQSVGIVKGRDWLLQDGDVLETAQKYLVLVRIQQQQVIALQFEPGANNRSISLIHLGHVLGNRHWPITLQGEILFVELVAEAELMKSTIREMARTLKIEKLQISLQGRSADAALDFSAAHHHAH